MTDPQPFSIPFARVDCGGNELAYVKKVLESGWLTTGQMVESFETRFACAVQAKHALAVSSCTAALHLALDAVGIGPGDKVLVPTMTFASTVEVICYLNAVPVLMDVDPDTSLVSETIAAEAIANNPDAKAMIVVHYGGQAAPMLGVNGLVKQCRAAGMSLIEDAAHAFPASENERPVGCLGDVTCFSFYANKTITTGEGGMVTCSSDVLAKRMRLMRLHGINRDVWTRYQDANSSVKWEYDVVAAGYKYNMPDLNAAVGLAQFERADAMREGRQRIAERYRATFNEIDSVTPIVSRVEDHEHAWHLFPIKLSVDDCETRNEFIARMAEAGIGTSVHYKPVHQMSYYRKLLSVACQDFPGAEQLWRRTVSLPIYHTMSDQELDHVCETVGKLSEVSVPLALIKEAFL